MKHITYIFAVPDDWQGVEFPFAQDFPGLGKPVRIAKGDACAKLDMIWAAVNSRYSVVNHLDIRQIIDS